jgi:hypothetical protein
MKSRGGGFGTEQAAELGPAAGWDHITVSWFRETQRLTNASQFVRCGGKEFFDA